MVSLPAAESQNDLDALALRKALYGGLAGSIGATAGWLVWIALQVGWKVLLAPAVGVVLDLVIRWFEYHRAVARTETIEASDPTIPAPQNTPSQSITPTRTFRLSMKRVVAFSSPVLLLLLLGVVVDIIKDVLVPYLQSVVTIFPVGAVFGLMTARNFFAPRNFGERLALGVMGGVLATGISLLLFFAMGGRSAINNFASGWWVLVGIGFAFAHVEEANARRVVASSLGSVAILLLLIALLATFNLDRALIGGLGIIPSTINSVLAGPDLPATSWDDVNIKSDNKKKQPGSSPSPERRAAAKSTTGCDLPPLEISRERIIAACSDLLPGATCAAPACINLDAECPFKSLNQSRECIQRRSACEEQIALVKQDIARPDSDSALAREARETEKRQTPQLYRRRLLCRQLSFGLGSGLVRSLLAIVLFAASWGWGMALETSHRPRDYSASKTRKLDLIVLISAAVFALGVIVISRLFPG